MPPIKKKRRVYKKKSYGKSFKSKSFKKAVRKAVMFPYKSLGTIVPTRMKTKLIYSDTYILNPPLIPEPFRLYTFRGNSTYDPDDTGVGNQPTGRDQWYAFYQRSCVTSSKIYITATIESASTAQLYRMVIVPGNFNTMVTGNDPEELPMAKSRTLATPSQQSRSVISMKHQARTSKVWGLFMPALYESNFYETESANPLNQWWWNIWFRTAVATNNTDQITFTAKIIYNVCFFDRKILGPS